MHVIEKYALETGAKIGNPFVYEKFFPLTIDGDYITFQSSSHQSKQYSHWEEVISLIGTVIIFVGPQPLLSLRMF